MSEFLVADIGGTNARCALASVDALGRRTSLSETRVYRCAELSSVDAMLARYGADTANSLPGRVALAVAGPVTGDRITLTNNDWNFSTEQLRRRFDFQQLVVMNDLAAVAHATRHLRTTDLLTVKPGQADTHATRVVIGVGTGLGVAALKRSGDAWFAIPSEAGHGSFAPTSALETKAAALAAQELDMASWESVLSGPGLERRYRAHTGSEASSHDIVSGAQSGDAVCVSIVRDFCQTLARFASDATLWFNATGGVYLAGGLLHDLLPWLEDASFVPAFDDKGVMAPFVRKIPVSLIVADQPGLIGAAVGAHSLTVPASRAPVTQPASEIKQ
ncbi:MAG: ROK family protein [Pseudomonadota bacterium]